MGEEAEALADRVRRAGCLFVGRSAGHRLRRLRGRLATTCCPPAARRGSSRRSRPPPSGAGWRAYRSPTRRPRAWRPRAPRSRGPRAFPSTPSRWSAAHEPHAQTSPAPPARPTSGCRSTSTASGAGERETGVGFFDHMLDARRAPRRARPGRAGARATWRPARTTRSRTPASRFGAGARRGAGRPRGHRPLRPGRGADGRGAGRARRSTCPGRPFTGLRGRRAAGAIGDFDTDLAEEFFRAVANTAKLTLHLRLEAGTNAHHMVEALFKAFARALRAAVADRPGSERGALDQGPAVIADPRLRHGQPALGREGARARGRRGRAHARPRRGPRAPTAWCCPAWGRSRGRWRPCATLGFDELLRERVEAGRARARHLPGHAAAVRVHHRARRRGGHRPAGGRGARRSTPPG